MALPEPIVPLKGKAAKDFADRLAKFKVKDKSLYAGARKAYQKAKKRPQP